MRISAEARASVPSDVLCLDVKFCPQCGSTDIEWDGRFLIEGPSTAFIVCKRCQDKFKITLTEGRHING